MNGIYRFFGAGIILAGTTLGGLAQVAETPPEGEEMLPEVEPLPPYAYDVIAEISLVTTAADACTGIKVRDKPLRAAIQGVYTQLANDGIAPIDAAKHFETQVALAQIGLRGQAFRLEYGIGPENDDAFCQAVKARAKGNKPFRKMMKIRR